MTPELLRDAIDLAVEFDTAQKNRDKVAERRLLKKVLDDFELADLFLRAGLNQFAFLRPETVQVPVEFQWWMEEGKEVEGREAA